VDPTPIVPDPSATATAERSSVGLVAVSGAVTLMGIGSVVAKAAEIAGPILAFHRVWIAAVIYVAIFVVFGGCITTSALRAAVPGGLVFGAQVGFFFSAIQLTTVANATMIIALQPVVILLFFSRRFGEATGGGQVWLALLALVGIGLVVFGSTESPSWSPVGDLLSVGALATWTLYFVYSKQARQTLGALEYQGLSLVFSALVMLPVAFAFEGTVDPGPGKWWWIAAMVATPGTGHMLMNWAHARVPLGLVSEMTLLSPVISVALAALVLDGETLNLTQVAGMGLVLGTLAVMVRSTTR
jgi:drug/metabolite transporter (DMT)-like permease